MGSEIELVGVLQNVRQICRHYRNDEAKLDDSDLGSNDSHHACSHVTREHLPMSRRLQGCHGKSDVLQSLNPLQSLVAQICQSQRAVGKYFACP